MATASDVERSLRTLMKRLDEARLEPDSLPARTIVCVAPDLQTAWLTELRDARFHGLTTVETGTRADAKITARSDDLIALIEGRLNVGFAFLTGKIRVEAHASDLLMIRRLF